MGKFSIRIKKQDPAIKEDGAQDILVLQQQKAKLTSEIGALEQKFAQDKKRLTDQIAQIDIQLAKLGSVANAQEGGEEKKESVNESVAYGKHKELASLVKDAFVNIEDKLSYFPSDKEEEKFYENIARGIIRVINDNGYNISDDVDRTAELKDGLAAYFKRGVASYSEKEIGLIVDSIKDVITKSDNTFSWLFK